MRIALLLLALLAPLAAQSLKPSNAVRQLLEQQQAAWNRRDLDAFMAGYWNSPRLTFFGTRKTSGWQATLDRYRKTYQGAGHEMGKLEFSDLQIEELARDAAFVRGRCQLTLSRQNPARMVHPHVSPLPRRLEDRSRPQLAGGVNSDGHGGNRLSL